MGLAVQSQAKSWGPVVFARGTHSHCNLASQDSALNRCCGLQARKAVLFQEIVISHITNDIYGYRGLSSIFRKMVAIAGVGISAGVPLRGCDARRPKEGV